MKGTRLWQEPRSPLISGRSRRERPFSRDWIMGSLLAALIAAGLLIAVLLPKGISMVSEGLVMFAVVVTAAPVGCALTVFVARRVGWRPPWVAGSIGGAMTACGAVGAYIAWFATAVGK